jgi:hypothetical protein
MIAVLGGRCAERRPIVATVSDETLRELEERLGNMREGLLGLAETLRQQLEGDKELEDEQVENVIEALGAKPPGEHAGILLALHKCVENATYGRARYLVRLEALTLVTLLNRLLPGVVDQTLSDWEWAEIVERLEGGGDDA